MGLVTLLLIGCQADESAPPQHFARSTRHPTALSTEQVQSIAHRELRAGESLTSAAAYPAEGLGERAVQVVATTADGSRAVVIDEEGTATPTEVFWKRERAALRARYGAMSRALFEQVDAAADPEALFEVEILVAADAPEAQLPDEKGGTVEQLEAWHAAHSEIVNRAVAVAKARVEKALEGAEIVENPRSLPVIRARVSKALLMSAALNAEDIASIDAVFTEAPRLRSDHAGHISMNATALNGGSNCGTSTDGNTPCTGGHIVVGLWEKDTDGIGPTIKNSGLAMQNPLISTGNVMNGYLNCPSLCTTDADCQTSNGDAGLGDSRHFCIQDVNIGANCPSTAGQKHCVQDHLTWVAASVGMHGQYSYNTLQPGGVADSTPNVPAAQTPVPYWGAWLVNWLVGNDPGLAGLDFLVAPPTGVGALYINRSESGPHTAIEFAARAHNIVFTLAAGNSGLGAPTDCYVAGATWGLRNILCVGSYDYRTFDNLSTHVRSAFSSTGNPTSDPTLERPHLLGPGTHFTNSSGLHMPAPNAASGISTMWSSHDFKQGPFDPIQGTSFAAPAVLSAAIQAQQYAGWFSALAFPVANKAVILASTQDANADGNIGNANTWSGQTSDAVDGAGQINFAFTKALVDNSRFLYHDLADSELAACGTNCRKYVAASVAVPSNVSMRVALVWQSCMTSETGTPVLNNDLDLVVNCGLAGQICGGSITSNTVTSETEMVERPACATIGGATKSCAIEVRIKNGTTLASCGSTASERFGLAWSFGN